jgi:hypothetical protein
VALEVPAAAAAAAAASGEQLAVHAEQSSCPAAAALHPHQPAPFNRGVLLFMSALLHRKLLLLGTANLAVAAVPGPPGAAQPHWPTLTPAEYSEC